MAALLVVFVCVALAAAATQDPAACLDAVECLKARHGCVVACGVSVADPLGNEADPDCLTGCVVAHPQCMKTFAAACTPAMFAQANYPIPEYVWGCYTAYHSTPPPASVQWERATRFATNNAFHVTEDWATLVVGTSFFVLAGALTGAVLRPYVCGALRVARIWCAAYRTLGHGECAVCCDTIALTQGRNMCLCCGHIYHGDCWREWRRLHEVAPCPTCRTHMIHATLLRALSHEGRMVFASTPVRGPVNTIVWPFKSWVVYATYIAVTACVFQGTIAFYTADAVLRDHTEEMSTEVVCSMFAW